LLNKEDLTLDQASTREEQWAYYVDSYYMHADTEGVALDMLAPPWLRRSVFPSEVLQEASVVLNELQVKICLNTYKLFYLVNTEDTLVRHKVNRIVDTRKLAYNRAARIADGKKWTQDGYHTKEEQNAAAAAAAEAREQHVVPLGTAVSQTSPPAASSATPAPQPDVRQSANATPIPLSTEEPAPRSDVKVESPPIPAESGEAMDIEPVESVSVAPEPAQEEPQVMDEDVEMPDA
jgi:hypothetical protein